MTKREQIITLWRTCFQDSEEFIRFYFDRKYKDEDALLYTENGIPTAASLMLPYPMLWQGITLQTAYISGACTHPTARKRGLMTRLLQESFREMYNRGIAFSTLIPAEEWLYGFYGHLGYATTFFHRHTRYTPSPTPQTSNCTVKIIDTLTPDVISATYSCFCRYMHTYPCHIIHTFDDFQDILTDLNLAQGTLAIAYAHDTPSDITGFALALPGHDRIILKEIGADTEGIRNELLRQLALRWESKTITIPASSPEASTPYGMARIICLLPLLEHLAARHPQLQLSLNVTDPILPENQGFYTLAEGHCKKTNPHPDHPVSDISTLSRFLLTYDNTTPYMNLMLE